MTTPSKPPAQLPAAVVDHDARTITLAVTFDWRKEGIHLDHCEAGVLVGEVRRALVAHFRGSEWNQLAALRSVMTWEPNEERLVGIVGRPQPLYVEPEPTEPFCPDGNSIRDCLHAECQAAAKRVYG